MTDPRFGYSYPAGAEEDPNAPWNKGYSDADYEEDYAEEEPDD